MLALDVVRAKCSPPFVFSHPHPSLALSTFYQTLYVFVSLCLCPCRCLCYRSNSAKLSEIIWEGSTRRMATPPPAAIACSSSTTCAGTIRARSFINSRRFAFFFLSVDISRCSTGGTARPNIHNTRLYSVWSFVRLVEEACRVKPKRVCTVSLLQLSSARQAITMDLLTPKACE